LIVKAARTRNLQYPPTGYEHESFGDFLNHFNSIIIVRRRKARDLLAAPADMPQLLAEAPESGETRLRETVPPVYPQLYRCSCIHVHFDGASPDAHTETYTNQCGAFAAALGQKDTSPPTAAFPAGQQISPAPGRQFAVIVLAVGNIVSLKTEKGNSSGG
jgi:hypothetical protein